MLSADVARVEDWEGDPDRFIQRTVDRWVAEAGGHDVAKYFGLFVRLSRTPGGVGEVFGDRCYLEVWQGLGDHYGVILKPVIDKLETIDRRFPSMFWRRFSLALWSIGLAVWDPLWALEQEDDWFGEYVDEGVDGLEDEDRKEYEDEHLPSRVVPASLRRGWVKDATVRRALRQRDVHPLSWEGELLEGALDLYAATRGKDLTGWRSLTDSERHVFQDHGEPSPSLVAVMEQHDAIAHLIEYQGDSIMNGGLEIPPSCIWGFDVEPSSISAAHASLKRFLAICRRAAELIPLLEYPDGRPLVQTLVEVRV
jgi:hypothetical protein